MVSNAVERSIRVRAVTDPMAILNYLRQQEIVVPLVYVGLYVGRIA